MAISIDWGTSIITVPRADMTLVQSSPIEVRELEINSFRLTLRALEDDFAGMAELDTHIHVAPITVGGVTLARVVELINGYTVTFEDGQYAVNIVGGNSNISDKININQVSVRSANSAGLIQQDQLDSVVYSVESLRHTHQGFGQAFYVSPTGSDTNTGTSPDAPKATIAGTLSVCVSGRGDIIYLLGPDTGVASWDENVVVNVEDVHFRGAGRGTQIQPTSGVPLTVTANNCSFRGFVIRAPVGSTTTDCVVVNAKFSEFQKVWVVGVGQGVGTGRGVVVQSGDYHEFHDMEVEKCGGCGFETDDINDPTNGNPREITIFGGNWYLNGGNGICLNGRNGAAVGATTRIVRILGDANIHANTGFGISGSANTDKVMIAASTHVHGNNGGHMQPQFDILGDAHNEIEEHPHHNAEAVWDYLTDDIATVGSIGLFVKNKLLTVGKFLGLK